MSKKQSVQDWARDFECFASVEERVPPLHVSAKVFDAVHHDLNPEASWVFAKLGLIQLLVGALVLAMCPQFGISIFPGMGLMTLFMRYGETACMLGCGSVFLGASSLLGSLILRPGEIRVIRRSRLLQLGVMATLSSGVFACLGGEMMVTLGVAWVAGSLLGGLGSLELGWLVRSRLRRGIR